MKLIFPAVVIITDINNYNELYVFLCNQCLRTFNKSNLLQFLFLVLFILYHLGLEIAMGLLLCAILALVLLNTGNKEIRRFLLLQCRFLEPRLRDGL